MGKHNGLRTLRLSFLSALVALVACIFLTVGVSAHAVSHSRAGVSTAPQKVTTVQIITDKYGHYVFNKKEVQIYRGDVLRFCNKTHVDQTLQSQGYDLFTVPAGYCVQHTVKVKPGSYVTNLKSNPNAVLVILVK